VSDPGLAMERTTLAWHRTGLSSVAVGAVCLKAFWGQSPLGLVLGGLLVVLGVGAYALGAAAPAPAGRVRTVSLAITVAAAIGALLSIVG
jgi:uncharacterized membrane protein YidH (DUF202 family)